MRLQEKEEKVAEWKAKNPVTTGWLIELTVWTAALIGLIEEDAFVDLIVLIGEVGCNQLIDSTVLID